jgi:hypothetical protein
VEVISILIKEVLMMKKLLAALINIIVILLIAGCASAVRYDGPYKGQVIDADTGKSIEGVVVLGVWYKQNPGPGGAVSEYYDAMETVTDKNGEFKIKGLGLLVMSNIIPMDVLIFKAGYEYESGLWSALKKYAKEIKWEGEKAIIPLKKLTMEERKEKRPPSRPSLVPDEKMRKLTEEISKERMSLGLEPF